MRKFKNDIFLEVQAEIDWFRYKIQKIACIAREKSVKNEKE